MNKIIFIKLLIFKLIYIILFVNKYFIEFLITKLQLFHQSVILITFSI